MTLIQINADLIDAALEEILSVLVEAYEEHESQSSWDITPVLLGEALAQFLLIIKRIENDTNLTGADMSLYLGSDDETGSLYGEKLSSAEITDLGDHGMQLMGDLVYWAGELDIRDEVRTELDRQTICLAMWLVKHGAELHTLEPIVDALARIANRISRRNLLEELCNEMAEIISAVSPSIQYDMETTNPGRPWRVLIINYGIMATRTHNTRLMESAFQILVENLPDDAPQFFSEGLEQMMELNYPEEVRDVMQKYFLQWSAKGMH